MKRCTLELQTIEIYGNDTMNILKKVDILRISEAERLYDFEVFHFHEINYSCYLVYSHISYFTTYLFTNVIYSRIHEMDMKLDNIPNSSIELVDFEAKLECMET